MKTHNETPRIKVHEHTDANNGIVKWAPLKSLWYTAHVLIAVIAGYFTFSISALLIFIVFTAITLCFGHSLGMHRRLIHNSYECPLWLEYFFVHLGVLVGMAGPLGMMHQHDLRDWAQRKPQCHPYLRHGNGFLKDGWWQLHCDLQLKNPPEFQPENSVKFNKIYRFMERTWMLQQLPWALLLFYFGGISWVVWGISARIAISVTGHWLIGYFAHNQGDRDWHVEGAAVQGYNLKIAAVITMGESWHNNHHAFPGSAVLGIYKDQIDVGWCALNTLHNIGLVWDLKLPKNLDARTEVMPINKSWSTNRKLNAPKPCYLLGLIAKI